MSETRRRPFMTRSKTLIFIPTFNERENVTAICTEIGKLGLDADLLFMDDHSPDGTGELLEELARANPRVRVRHRKGKLGVGSAHQEGIAQAYREGYETLVTMDCDFTHSPSDIPRLLKACQNHDLAVGSRYMHPGSLPGWNLYRRCLTRFGHWMTSRFLDLPHDASGAFRVYRLDRIPQGLFQLVQSRSYAFFFESLFLMKKNGVGVNEIPIVLPARTYGHSKLSHVEALRSLSILFSLSLRNVAHPERFRIGRPPDRLQAELTDPQGWDAYWIPKERPSSLAYEFVAAIYRRNVIRRNLNAFIRRHFERGSRLLHAGCGSGQVDVDLQHEMRLTGLDISMVALDLYSRNNPRAESIQQGDLLELPFGEGEFDGIYNLGVMEHFTEGEIHRILCGFHRVLKPGGKVVLFWPHRFASSVLFLNSIHWILRHIFQKKGRLHPPEISLFRSRPWVRPRLEKAGLQLVECHFGVRDGFVQAVVVARRNQG